MVSFRVFSVCLLLAGIGVPAIGQDKAQPQWKFEKDKTFYQEMTVDMDQTMAVMGQQIPVKVKQTTISSWTPVKQLEDKSWVVKEKILGLKIDMELFGQKQAYDSQKPNDSPKELADGLTPIIGTEFEQTIGPDMKITKVKGYQEFVDKLGKNDPKVKQMVSGMFTEDTLKEMGDALFGMLPNKSVARGDSWSQEQKVAMPSLGTLTTKRTFTYVGKKGELDEIKMDAKLVKHEPPAGAVGGALPFSLKKLDLKKFEAKATLLFDSEKGRLASGETTIEMEGKMKIEVQKMEAEVDLKQSQKITVKTLDKNPIK